MTDLAKDKERFTRLPGRSGMFSANQQRLWMGDGYILNLIETWFTERHNRFYLDDIQAITYHRTARRDIYTGILFGILLLFLVLGVYVSSIFGGLSAGAVAIWVVCAFFGIVALVNIARGPTCVCRVYTAVQSVKLEAVAREREARRFVAQVRPFIEGAQGQVTREYLEAQGDLSEVQAGAYVEQNPAVPKQTEAKPAASGRLHLAGFAALVLLGALSFLRLAEPGAVLDWIAIFVTVFYVGMIVSALIAQRSQRVSPGLSRLTIAAIVYSMITLSLGSIIIAISAEFSGEELGPISPTRIFSDNPWFRGYMMVGGSVELLLGIAGCLLTVDFMRTRPLYSPGRFWRPASAANPDAASDGDGS